jgi:hypothetical protein
MSSPCTCGSRLCTHFVTKLYLIHTCSHAGIQHFLRAPSTEESRFYFYSKLLGRPWELIKLPFCHLWAGLIFEPGFLPVQQVALPSLVPAPHQVPLCIQSPHPNKPRGRTSPPPDQTVHWCLVGSHLPAVQGMHSGNKGGEKPPSPKSQTGTPRNVVGFWNRDMGF